MILFLALEGFSLISYILVTYTQTYGSIISAVKYFIFGTFGSIWLLWGIAQLYFVLPSLSLNLWVFIIKYLMMDSSTNNLLFGTIDFSSSLFVIGFLIKLGAAPTHQWVADVYSGANLIITFLLATFVKVVLVIIFVKLANLVVSDILVDCSIISSLIIGCFNAVKQTELKRFIAYSSIVHTAFLLSGDVTSIFLYLVTYVLANILLFTVLINLSSCNKEIIYLSDLSKIRQAGYLDTVSIISSIASVAGLPPLAGFYGKFLVLSSLVEDLYLYNNLTSYLILNTNLVVTLIIFFYYMRVISYIFIKSDNQVGWLGSTVLTSHNWLDLLKFLVLSGIVIWTLYHSSLIRCVDSISYCFML
jgi:NADH-quinone oxidoreductase subunit N